MSLIRVNCLTICHKCLVCIYNIYCFLLTCFGFTICCALFLLSVMLFLIYLFYLSDNLDKPTVSALGSVDVYDYNHEYPIMKRDTYYEEAYSSLEDYFENAGIDNDLQRNKRENKTTTTKPTTASTEKSSKATNGPSKAPSSSKKNTEFHNHEHPREEEEELDFKLSNSLVDSIFSTAENMNLKQPLGLCRRTSNIKLPDMNVTLFPTEEAEEIIACINDLLRNQTKKQLCIQLDSEMNAYLKWLILTGESKERRKQIIISAKDDFLFPSTCSANQTYEFNREGDFKMIVHHHDNAGKPVEPETTAEVLTTCVPVLASNKDKSKKN